MYLGNMIANVDHKYNETDKETSEIISRKVMPFLQFGLCKRDAEIGIFVQMSMFAHTCPCRATLFTFKAFVFFRFNISFHI